MRSLYLLMVIGLVFTLSACSSKSDVTSPEIFSTPENTAAQDWGSYGLSFDPATEKVEIIYEREASAHFEITSYLNPPACGGSGCISASFVAWDPINQILTYNVGITNPTVWTPSDVRMIFYWLGGRKIVNADSFTRSFVGTIEPFIAFGKANPNRTFPGGATITETVQIFWPPLSPFTVWFKVSAYLWLNCQDPYEINGMFQAGDLFVSGGNATIGCNVLDWQNNVNSVTADTTPITGGLTNLGFVGGTLWQTNISNTTGALPGIYVCLITARSPNPQNFDLYNYIKLEVKPDPSGWIEDGTWGLPPGPCSLDLGIIANSFPGHALMAGPDAAGSCNQIQKFPGWANPPAFYASLVNLDPTRPAFQPYPVVRIDASNDGAFGWTNMNTMNWLDPPPFPIANYQTYCNFDRIPSFIWNPEVNDHRHYMIGMQEFALTPVDVCDTFKNDQCAIYVEIGFGMVGFQGIPGGPFGFDYTDADIIWEAIFPPALVGPEPGQVDPGDIVGIDAKRSQEQGVLTLYVALKANWRIEVFDIIDAGPGPVDIVVPRMTIPVLNQEQMPNTPIDIELLPQWGRYKHAPDDDILCVLVDNAAWPAPPPGFGGSVLIFNANTGALVDQIGDPAVPAVWHPPAYLDTDDSAWAVHITQWGPFVTQITYNP